MFPGERNVLVCWSDGGGGGYDMIGLIHPFLDKHQFIGKLKQESSF